MKPKYKKLYEQEKIRREFYEKMYPNLSEQWNDVMRRSKELRDDIEKSILFGVTK